MDPHHQPSTIIKDATKSISTIKNSRPTLRSIHRTPSIPLTRNQPSFGSTGGTYTFRISTVEMEYCQGSEGIEGSWRRGCSLGECSEGVDGCGRGEEGLGPARNGIEHDLLVGTFFAVTRAVVPVLIYSPSSIRRTQQTTRRLKTALNYRIYQRTRTPCCTLGPHLYTGRNDDSAHGVEIVIMKWNLDRA